MKMKTQLINKRSAVRNKSTNQNVALKISEVNNPLVTTLSKGKRKIAEVTGMKARPLHQSQGH